MKDLLKPNDILVATINKPNATTLDLLRNNINAENTQLLNIDEYRKSEYIQKAFAEPESGKFDNDKFTAAYVSAYKKMEDLNSNNIIKNLMNDREYNSYNLYAPIDSKRKKNRVYYKELNNPLQRSIGIEGLNKVSDPLKTPEELAQSNKIWDSKNKKWLEDTPESLSIFEKFGGETLVYAKWEEDGVDENGIIHKAGDWKTDENGRFYTETLGNRQLLSKLVVSVEDILTDEDSKLNKYDFFDSDGFTKSVGGTAMKTIVKIVPYVIPYVNKVWGGLAATWGVASALPSLYKSFESMFTGSADSDLAEKATHVENWFLKYTPSKSHEGRNGFFTMEGFAEMVGDVFSQLHQQRAAARFAKHIKGFDPDKASIEDWKKMNEVSKRFSLGYMALTQSADTYNLTLVAGYDEKTAGFIALASSAALYGIMKYNEGKTGFGTWMLDKTTGYNQDISTGKIRSVITTQLKEIAPLFEKLLNTKDKTVAKKIGSEFRNVVRNTLGYTEDFWKAMIVEGAEEVSEEAIQDAVKGIVDTASYLGYTEKRGSFGGWSNVFSKEGLARYASTFIGGAVGGGIFQLQRGVIEPFFDPKLKQKNKDLMQLMVEGYGDIYIQELERYRKVINDQLSGDAIDVLGNNIHLTGTGKSAGDMIIDAAIKEAQLYKLIVSEITSNLMKYRDITDTLSIISLAEKYLYKSEDGSTSGRIRKLIKNDLSELASEISEKRLELDEARKNIDDKEKIEKIQKEYTELLKKVNDFVGGKLMAKYNLWHILSTDIEYGVGIAHGLVNENNDYKLNEFIGSKDAYSKYRLKKSYADLDSEAQQKIDQEYEDIISSFTNINRDEFDKVGMELISSLYIDHMKRISPIIKKGEDVSYHKIINQVFKDAIASAPDMVVYDDQSLSSIMASEEEWYLWLNDFKVKLLNIDPSGFSLLKGLKIKDENSIGKQLISGDDKSIISIFGIDSIEDESIKKQIIEQYQLLIDEKIIQSNNHGLWTYEHLSQLFDNINDEIRSGRLFDPHISRIYDLILEYNENLEKKSKPTFSLEQEIPLLNINTDLKNDLLKNEETDIVNEFNKFQKLLSLASSKGVFDIIYDLLRNREQINPELQQYINEWVDKVIKKRIALISGPVFESEFGSIKLSIDWLFDIMDKLSQSESIEFNIDVLRSTLPISQELFDLIKLARGDEYLDFENESSDEDIAKTQHAERFINEETLKNKYGDVCETAFSIIDRLINIFKQDDILKDYFEYLKNKKQIDENISTYENPVNQSLRELALKLNVNGIDYESIQDYLFKQESLITSAESLSDIKLSAKNIKEASEYYRGVLNHFKSLLYQMRNKNGISTHNGQIDISTIGANFYMREFIKAYNIKDFNESQFAVIENDEYYESLISQIDNLSDKLGIIEIIHLAKSKDRIRDSWNKKREYCENVIDHYRRLIENSAGKPLISLLNDDDKEKVIESINDILASLDADQIKVYKIESLIHDYLKNIDNETFKGRIENIFDSQPDVYSNTYYSTDEIFKFNEGIILMNSVYDILRLIILKKYHPLELQKRYINALKKANEDAAENKFNKIVFNFELQLAFEMILPSILNKSTENNEQNDFLLLLLNKLYKHSQNNIVDGSITYNESEISRHINLLMGSAGSGKSTTVARLLRIAKQQYNGEDGDMFVSSLTQEKANDLYFNLGLKLDEGVDLTMFGQNGLLSKILTRQSFENILTLNSFIDKINDDLSEKIQKYLSEYKPEEEGFFRPEHVIHELQIELSNGTSKDSVVVEVVFNPIINAVKNKDSINVKSIREGSIHFRIKQDDNSGTQNELFDKYVKLNELNENSVFFIDEITLFNPFLISLLKYILDKTGINAFCLGDEMLIGFNHSVSVNDELVYLPYNSNIIFGKRSPFLQLSFRGNNSILTENIRFLLGAFYLIGNIYNPVVNKIYNDSNIENVINYLSSSRLKYNISPSGAITGHLITRSDDVDYDENIKKFINAIKKSIEEDNTKKIALLVRKGFKELGEQFLASNGLNIENVKIYEEGNILGAEADYVILYNIEKSSSESNDDIVRNLPYIYTYSTRAKLFTLIIEDSNSGLFSFKGSRIESELEKNVAIDFIDDDTIEENNKLFENSVQILEAIYTEDNSGKSFTLDSKEPEELPDEIKKIEEKNESKKSAPQDDYTPLIKHVNEKSLTYPIDGREPLYDVYELYATYLGANILSTDCIENGRIIDKSKLIENIKNQRERGANNSDFISYLEIIEGKSINDLNDGNIIDFINKFVEFKNKLISFNFNDKDVKLIGYREVVDDSDSIIYNKIHDKYPTGSKNLYLRMVLDKGGVLFEVTIGSIRRYTEDHKKILETRADGIFYGIKYEAYEQMLNDIAKSVFGISDDVKIKEVVEKLKQNVKEINGYYPPFAPFTFSRNYKVLEGNIYGSNGVSSKNYLTIDQFKNLGWSFVENVDDGGNTFVSFPNTPDGYESFKRFYNKYRLITFTDEEFLKNGFERMYYGRLWAVSYMNGTGNNLYRNVVCILKRDKLPQKCQDGKTVLIYDKKIFNAIKTVLSNVTKLVKHINDDGEEIVENVKQNIFCVDENGKSVSIRSWQYTNKEFSFTISSEEDIKKYNERISIFLNDVKNILENLIVNDANLVSAIKNFSFLYFLREINDVNSDGAPEINKSNLTLIREIFSELLNANSREGTKKALSIKYHDFNGKGGEIKNNLVNAADKLLVLLNLTGKFDDYYHVTEFDSYKKDLLQDLTKYTVEYVFEPPRFVYSKGNKEPIIIKDSNIGSDVNENVDDNAAYTLEEIRKYAEELGKIYVEAINNAMVPDSLPNALAQMNRPEFDKYKSIIELAEIKKSSKSKFANRDNKDIFWRSLRESIITNSQKQNGDSIEDDDDNNNGCEI